MFSKVGSSRKICVQASPGQIGEIPFRQSASSPFLCFAVRFRFETGGTNIQCEWFACVFVTQPFRSSSFPSRTQSFLQLWLCLRFFQQQRLWEHELITETKVTMKENLTLEALNYDFDVPCPLRRDCCGSQHRQTSVVSS